MPLDLSPLPTAGVLSVPPSPALAAPIGDAAFEERWAAWVARGHRHNAAVRRKVRLVAIAVAVVIVVGLGFGLLGGSL
jgi:4-amino-4-deoxy-L-arabinose transferase-like glycosyltransferase